MAQIKFASEDLQPEIQALLTENDLPVSDISDRTKFLAAQSGQELVGCVAMEQYGGIGLLRSLVVTPQHRSTGVAKLLCDELFRQMKQRSIGEVYLLTTTAAGFFEKLGFQRVQRETAPPPIQQTQQFRGLCPSSAVIMRKDLI